MGISQNLGFAGRREGEGEGEGEGDGEGERGKKRVKNRSEQFCDNKFC